MNDEYPKLRYLEAIPFQQKGENLVLLRDPRQISEAALAVTPELYALIRLFNGRNSLREIHACLDRTTGEPDLSAQLEQVVRTLDEAFFLENRRFSEQEKAVISAYRAQSVRRPYHAGQGYPEQSHELRRMIEGFYRAEGGAGTPDGVQRRQVRAVAAPHIDLRLGGPTYTHAYRALAESSRPDLFVILGIGHMGLPQSFSIGRKDFETPLGRARVDREFLAELDRQLPGNVFAEDLSHRSEHTIEFQILFLQQWLGDSFTFLPILSSFSYAEIFPGSPVQKRIEQMVEGLQAAEESLGKKACYIASVDLAHIGPRYGDGFRPTPETVESQREKDRRMLDILVSQDAGAFLENIRAERDERRICGFPALYTLRRLLGKSHGRVLAHSHGEMDETGAFVTYAALEFPKETRSDQRVNRGKGIT